MRHAEKSREASCPLADAIALKVKCEYMSRVPSSLRERYRQTVLAAIVSLEGTDIRVLSMGIGTKTLPTSVYMDERRSCSSDACTLVRDCHAEVLARRGFVRFLYEEINRLCDNDGNDDAQKECILFRDKDGMCRLKSQVSIHLYTSSSPCGNASVKKWAKGGLRTTFDGMTFEWSFAQPHPKLLVKARADGEVALLLKKDGTIATTTSTSTTVENGKQPFPPPGTALVSSSQGICMSCSDKILKWNCLGLQGSLLSQIMYPVYLSSIVIGRKFSQGICERALCCRLQDFDPNQGIPQGNNSNEVDSEYFIHHPSMLGTAIKFDENAIITNQNKNDNDEHHHSGANFNESLCYCNWESSRIIMDCIINSKTGLCVNIEENNDSHDKNGTISTISSAAFFQSYLQLRRKMQQTNNFDNYENAKRNSGAYYRHRTTLYSDQKLLGDWIKKQKLFD